MSRGRSRGLLLSALMVVAGFTAVAPVAAQSTLELLAQRRTEYRAALDALQSARSSLQVIEQQFNAALRDIERARSTGDDDALATARARFQDLSVPKADRELRVQETAESVVEARRSVIEILIVRQSELIAMIDAAASAAERQRLGLELEDVSNQLNELEDEAEGPAVVMPTVMPSVNFDPRDGPTELLNKAQILERTAAVVDTVILDTDEQIQAFEERLRNERRRRDLLAGIDRFGDRILPTGPPRTDPTVQSSDSTAAGGRPVTLEERLEALRVYREELVEYRDQLLIKAEQFRLRVRRRS